MELYTKADRTFYFDDDEIKKIYHNNTKYFKYYLTLDLNISALSPQVGTVFLWTATLKNKTVWGRSVDELAEFFKILYENVITNKKNTHTKKLVVFMQKAQDLYYFIVNNKNFKVSKNPGSFFANKQNEIFYFSVNEYFEIRSLDMITEFSIDEESEIMGYSFRRNYEIENKLYSSESELESSIYKYSFKKNQVIHKFIDQFYFQNVKDSHGSSVKNIPLTATSDTKKILRQIHAASPNYENNKDFQFFACGYDRNNNNLLSDGISKSGINKYNIYFKNIELPNILSFDYDSFFPFLLFTKKFPGDIEEVEDVAFYESYLKNGALTAKNKGFFFEIEFEEIKIKSDFKNCNFLGGKKKDYIRGVKIEKDDQGKLLAAKKITYRISGIDYKNICRYYDFKSDKIKRAFVADLHYLPDWFKKTIYQLYCEKERLKQYRKLSKIDNVQYQQAKRRLNRIYGVLIESPDRVFKYLDDAGNLRPDEGNYTKQTDKAHYLYQWGIYVTAYARDIILRWIELLGDKFVYCDTDCIKFFYDEEILKIIEWRNNVNHGNIEKVCYYLKLPMKYMHHFGELQGEGASELFKVLDLKRYAEIKNNKFYCTVAGLTDDDKYNYFKKFDSEEAKIYNFNYDCKFECFTNKCISKKNTSAFNFTFIDSNGKKCTCKESGSIIYLDRSFIFDFSQEKNIINKFDLMLSNAEYLEKIKNKLNL